MKRELIATINGVEVGHLMDENDVWSFQYADAWIESTSSYDLSPALRRSARSILDGSSNRSVRWFFENLLPEEHQRVLMARDANLRDEADAFALLEYYGAESAGSLTLLPANASANSDSGLRQLDDAVLEGRIARLPNIPLTHEAFKRMSLAGAQHKLAVVLHDGLLYEPGGDTPSTHILKPNHQTKEDYPHTVINEWFVMTLARILGLPVPNVHRRYVPSPVYLIDRFDRAEIGGTWQRTHALDACQLLNLSRTYKYHQGSVSTLATIAEHCDNRATARTTLFSWLVFNVLIGNSDAHLKNISFLVSPRGVRLAPFYDLLSEAVYGTASFQKHYWPDAHTFAWPILGVSRYGEISRTLLIDAGQEIGIGRTSAARLLDDMVRRIAPAAEGLYSILERDNQTLNEMQPKLRATLAGELRTLRAIRYVVLKDMVKKLTA